MTHRRLGWLLALACAVVPLASASAASAVQLVPFVDVTAPTYVTSPPGDRHRLFVTSKFGDVRVVRDGVLQPTAFLDIQPDVVAASEQGLSSIAFAPDYATSGRFYVDYTAHRPGDSTGSILTVKEFRRSAASPDLADPTSGRTLLTVDHPVFDDHNAGQLQFGSDGMLYVSTGDGGDANDPPNNAQNRGSLLGKILRIDPRATTMAAYGIPADNPFVGVPGARPELYDYGLRNPWRFSFDRATGDMLIGDVGQGAREEVDYAPSGDAAGIDYGWRCMEGSIHARGLAHPCKPTGRYVGPILEYRHTQGCAVIGGVVARDLDLRGLYGRYLYGDFCTGEIRSLVPTGPRAVGDRATGLNVDGIDAFGEDSCGHVCMRPRPRGTSTGSRVRRARRAVPPPAT